MGKKPCQQLGELVSIGCMEPTIYIVTGPTAVGKTALCLEVAKELGAEIVSCDSMQVYMGMDIGTAKASVSELAAVPHHCLDLFPIQNQGDIRKYIKCAQEAISGILSKGKQVLVTGGSGFYLKSFLEPVCDGVEVPTEIRAEVEGVLEGGGTEAAVSRLLELNPEGVGGLDLQNPRRVARALERCLASGLPVLELKRRMDALPPPYPGMAKKVCVLSRGDGGLKSRIASRTAAMIDGGLVQEVERLAGEGLRENPVARSSIGYREVLAYLDGEIEGIDGLANAINGNTWQLVRKQRKWFRIQLTGANTVNLDECPQPGARQLFSGGV
jgi:tRNA dimethylallyltransferase